MAIVIKNIQKQQNWTKSVFFQGRLSKYKKNCFTEWTTELQKNTEFEQVCVFFLWLSEYEKYIRPKMQNSINSVFVQDGHQNTKKTIFFTEKAIWLRKKHRIWQILIFFGMTIEKNRIRRILQFFRIGHQSKQYAIW